MSREGWNGKGLTVRMQTPDNRSKMSLPYMYLEYPVPKNSHTSRVPWVPSITGLFAEDWFIYEE